MKREGGRMKVAVLSFAHERAATYARLLSATPGVDLLVADPEGPPDDPARGPAAARRLDAAYAGSWDKAFALRPDAVVVTSEVARRRELVERAAEIGAHVLCEQPLAATEADADAMARACADAGVRLAVAAPACCGPAFAAVRRQLADGAAIGALTTVHGAYHGPAAREAGGALRTHAAVLLDLVDTVLDGIPATQVYAQSNSVLSGDPDVESAALLTVRYADGTVAALDGSWSPPADPAGAGPTLTFVGERGSVEFTARPKLLGGFDSATGRERWTTGGADPCAAVLDAFVASLGTGHWAGPDGATGVRTLRVIRAAYESARTGRPVDVAVPEPARP
ncbi:Gfo/Idh/MocA family protein [Streptomyces sp. MNP-20]|uniref:Gfo/Idh/MocA family protein n=1 Tax=Streptomyces sp. MNP-20 TaxID=2721165 RepID=UPI0020A69679|nr:Gfo/Idh/MocA family oxidoreductase [Streptomyces sp. MNP-20]